MGFLGADLSMLALLGLSWFPGTSHWGCCWQSAWLVQFRQSLRQFAVPFPLLSGAGKPHEKWLSGRKADAWVRTPLIAAIQPGAASEEPGEDHERGWAPILLGFS